MKNVDQFKYIAKIFTITASIYFIVFYFIYGGLSPQNYWETLQTGLLAAGLTWINGVITDNIRTSWVKETVKSLLITVVLTVVGTLAMAFIIIQFCYLLQYGAFQIIPQKFYWTVLLITFFISLFMHGRAFLLEYKQSIEEKEAFKRAHLSSRLESLQNQVNPHFLFNSLNVLTNLVHKNADLSVQFIRQMSHVYRYILDHQQEELVSLSEEKEMLEAYLFLLKIRFGDSLQYNLDIETEYGDLIPPLSLQMLVENAVKHNIVSKKRPLNIVIQKNENSIIIKNNLQLKQQEHHSLGIGLDNIRERYSFIGQEQVEIKETEAYFTVVLPILKLNK